MRGLTWWLCTHLAPFISWLSLPNGPQGKATCVALPGTLYVAGLVSILQIFYLLHLLRTFSHLTFSLQLSSASSLLSATTKASTSPSMDPLVLRDPFPAAAC